MQLTQYVIYEKDPASTPDKIRICIGDTAFLPARISYLILLKDAPVYVQEALKETSQIWAIEHIDYLYRKDSDK